MTGPGLPPLLLLTDRSQLARSHRLTAVVADCVRAGLRAVVVRERDLEDRERAELVFDLRQVLAPVDGLLLVAAPELGRPDGVHLRSADAVPAVRPALLGRSCHHAGDLVRATRDGCDYVMVSPVAASASKPGHGPPLGTRAVEGLTRHRGVSAPDGEASRLPAVYALGGVTPDNAAEWLGAGADGVAVMGAVMAADDPAAVIATLLSVLDPGSPAPAEPSRPGAAATRAAAVG